MKLPPTIAERLASTSPEAAVALPAKYDALTRRQRVLVREAYAERQGGLCGHCKAPLAQPPAESVASLSIRWAKFPPGFLDHPVHLHHNHRTGLTIAAVHAHCNAVLWQYHGE